MTKMCTAAANYIINQVNKYNLGKPLEEQVLMSSKRLQKILYFSEVLYLVEHNGQSMFADDFHAWPSGPVIPAVYRKFMQYQDGQMYPYSGEIHDQLDSEMTSVIDRVLADTNHLGTNVLIAESHTCGGPWHSVYDENDSNYASIVDKAKIFIYYSQKGAPYGRNLATNN